MTSDTFLEEADEWRSEMWTMIRTRPDVRFYILTKRAPRIAACLPEDWGDGWENVELNITCENQRAFDERWPIFAGIPAKHKGMNLAPLLGPIDITPALASGQLESVCLGGEGFGGRRPCRYEWVKDISDNCARHQVNFTWNATGAIFVKDGRRYHIDSQLVQGLQAYKSGLSRFYQKPVFKLYDPVDGHLLTENELMKPSYNASRCVTCSSFETCIGCVDCGVCKDVRLVSKGDIERIRAEKTEKEQVNQANGSLSKSRF